MLKSIPVLFACSGCSNAGQLADKLARELNRRGIAEMSSLAGIGARKPHFLQKIAEREVWIIDGCPIECSLGVFGRLHGQVYIHIRLHDLGVRKNDPLPTGSRFDDLIEALLQQVAQQKQAKQATALNDNQHHSKTIVHKSILTVVLSMFAVPCLLPCLVVAQSESPSPSKEASAAEIVNDDSSQITKNSPATVGEARGRARILHEALHGSLQVMHRDFFREDEGLKIPSRSLEDVFRELSRSYGVQLHWLAVDAKAMNIDHEPNSEFEKEVVHAIKSGKQEFESVKNNRYQFAGRIRLSATCLSCHASRRSSNDDRSAALIISMPLHSEK